jgi:hypothetical protein
VKIEGNKRVGGKGRDMGGGRNNRDEERGKKRNEG